MQRTKAATAPVPEPPPAVDTAELREELYSLRQTVGELRDAVQVLGHIIAEAGGVWLPASMHPGQHLGTAAGRILASQRGQGGKSAEPGLFTAGGAS